VDYTPRVLWRRQTDNGNVIDAVLMHQVDEYVVAIRRDGLARDARAFAHQSDAIAWAEHVRCAEPY
jgi:type 1 glutamine amidotransferase